MSETETVADLAPEQAPAPAPFLAPFVTAPVAASTSVDIEALIARWFNEHVANSAISRGPIDVVNDLTQRAIPALVAMLKG